MTGDQFFLRLRSLNRSWKLVQLDDRGRRLIRSGRTCPICAVAGIPGTEWNVAAKRLGLRWSLALELVKAADDYGRSKKYRSRLLQATVEKSK